MNDRIRELCTQVFPFVVERRRDFHKYAESGWTEFRTASLIARELADLGFDLQIGREVLRDDARMGLPSAQELATQFNRAKEQGGDAEFLPMLEGGYTAVVGILRCGEGPVLALRFDIDALDISECQEDEHEPAALGFASINDNTMHACGHDCHAAVGLGLARILSSIKDDLQGTIKLVFQPAEEGVRGAKAVVEAGVLDDVNYLVGHHIMSGWAVGEVVCGMGGYAATRKFDALFTGHPAHAGGSPQKGKNALLAAATAVLGMHSIPRHGGGETRVNVGKMTAGSGRNVIPAQAILVAEVRGANSEVCDFMHEHALRVIRSAAQMYDCEVEITPMGEAESGFSDVALADRVRGIAERLGGFSFFELERSGGCEDFTFMMKRVQDLGGLATNIGIGADKKGISYLDKVGRQNSFGAHTTTFDVDETGMHKALMLLSAVCVDIAGKRK